MAEQDRSFAVLPNSRAVVKLPTATTEKLRAPATAAKLDVRDKKDSARVVLQFARVALGRVRATGFDVHLTDQPAAALSRTDKSFVGSINVFGHSHGEAGSSGATADHAEHHHTVSHAGESFDVTRAIAATTDERLEKLSIVLVPYPLLSDGKAGQVWLNSTATLKASGIKFLRVELQ